jgi:GT2 family glycosyltransferase
MVSVIIVNFNGLNNDFLPSCLHSLTQQNYPSLQIIVVDNASSDGSADYVANHFPNIILVKNPENVGFCRGNNIGFAYATGKYVMFVNNDTVLAKDCIGKLCYAIELKPDIGMVAPKLIRPSINDKVPPLLDSAGLLLQKNLLLRDRGFGEFDFGQYEEAAYLFAPCGAAAFFRKDVLEAVSRQCNGELWDEDFVAYYEDGDLAWRVRHKGWKCLYFPQAIVIHYRGGSSASAFFDKPFAFKVHTIKNRYLMLLKNASLWLIITQVLHLLRQEILIWGYLCLHPRLFIVIVRTLVDTLPGAFKKRKLIKPKTGKESLVVFDIEPLWRIMEND